MLHQFKILKGEVTYMSRFLQSDAYKKNSEKDRIVMSEFGTLAMPDPCKNFFQRFLSRFEMIGKLEKRDCILKNNRLHIQANDFKERNLEKAQSVRILLTLWKAFLLFVATEPTDNASVNFVKYKGDFYVSTETNFMHKVNLENLDTLEKVLL